MLARFGGLAVASDVPFPDLPAASGSPEISIRLGDVSAPGGELIQEWPDVDGNRWLTIRREGGGYRVSVPGLECRVSRDGREIVARPAPSLAEPTLVHLLLQQVLPLAVSRTGRLVLHACAVETPAGALAFVGETGAGKSTLSAAFCRRGYALIADDALVIEAGRRVAPTADALRLWPYMRDVAAGAEELPSASGKLRARVPIARQSSDLARIFLLGTAADESSTLAPVSASDLRVALLSHLFRLDVADHQESRRIFDAIHRLIEAVPVRRAVYPDGPQYLDAIVDVILRDSISLT
jgi:hypothetical protein